MQGSSSAERAEDGGGSEMEGADRGPVPHRVRLRSDPALWSDTELMLLSEAAALFWPDGGPLTTTSLRTAVKHNQLDIVEIAGKQLTNKASVEKMCRCGPRKTMPEDVDDQTAVSAGIRPATSAAEYSRIRWAGVTR